MAAPPPFPESQPLPPNPYVATKNPAAHDTYNQCLQIEQEAGNESQLLIYARCLGYLISEAPGDEARSFIINEILTCRGNIDKMNDLAELYINHLFRFFRRDKGKTPAPSDHSSPSSFKENITRICPPDPQDHKSAKMAAFFRDDYRCMVTGSVDSSYFHNLSRPDKIARGLTNATYTETNLCHIFPPSTNGNPDPETPNHPMYSGSVWAILEGFGGIKALDEFSGTNGHRLSNGLTMASSLHNEFDHLRLWFEEIAPVPNRYRVCTIYPGIDALHSLPHPRTVTFTTQSNLELPDPRYLRIHAAVCRVACMSGATGYLDKYDRELENRRDLADDGSSAELLASRLKYMIADAGLVRQGH